MSSSATLEVSTTQYSTSVVAKGPRTRLASWLSVEAVAFCVSGAGPPLLGYPATDAHDRVGGKDAVMALTCDCREKTCSCNSAFCLMRFCCSSLTSAISARMTSMVLFCFSMRLV